jgi:hypothetical protein
MQRQRVAVLDHDEHEFEALGLPEDFLIFVGHEARAERVEEVLDVLLLVPSWRVRFPVRLHASKNK